MGRFLDAVPVLRENKIIAVKPSYWVLFLEFFMSPLHGRGLQESCNGPLFPFLRNGKSNTCLILM